MFKNLDLSAPLHLANPSAILVGIEIAAPTKLGTKTEHFLSWESANKRVYSQNELVGLLPTDQIAECFSRDLMTQILMY